MNTPDDHRPVLLEAAIEALSLDPGGCYLDATYGRGGHAGAILDALDEAGRLYALDRDPDAVRSALERFSGEPRFRIWHGRFADLNRALAEMDSDRPLDGALFDLGVSSPQLDTSIRGFSFRADGPLDMRMDNTRGQSAAEWINRASEPEIARVLKDYGEERYARRIARAIVAFRSQQAFETTRQLADCIAAASPTREREKHPATRSFQAIRIQVNDELGQVEAGLEVAVERLAPGGRLVVISFHSLEDRIVKQFIRRESTPIGGRRLPQPKDRPLRLRRIGKPIFPDAEECARNPRARSAVMRVAERSDAT